MWTVIHSWKGRQNQLHADLEKSHNFNLNCSTKHQLQWVLNAEIISEFIVDWTGPMWLQVPLWNGLPTLMSLGGQSRPLGPLGGRDWPQGPPRTSRGITVELKVHLWSEEYYWGRTDGGTSPGAAFQHNFGGKVNLRCGGEGKPTAERIRRTGVLKIWQTIPYVFQIPSERAALCSVR